MNVATQTGRGRELADMMKMRRIETLCVQETRWRGSKARSIRVGFKPFCHGVNARRKGVGVILKERYIKSVLQERNFKVPC